MMLDILRPDSGRIAVFGGPMTERKTESVICRKNEACMRMKLWDVILYMASAQGNEPPRGHGQC